MRDRDVVLSHYPEAEAVEDLLPLRQSAPIYRCCWFVYDGPDLDACVLARATTEDQAWADAARGLLNPSKSTVSGGKTPKGSAVSGVHSIPREQLDTKTNWFG
jgi:hypothetical protein